MKETGHGREFAPRKDRGIVKKDGPRQMDGDGRSRRRYVLMDVESRDRSLSGSPLARKPGQIPVVWGRRHNSSTGEAGGQKEGMEGKGRRTHG